MARRRMEDPDKAAIRMVSLIQVICEPPAEKGKKKVGGPWGLVAKKEEEPLLFGSRP